MFGATLLAGGASTTANAQVYGGADAGQQVYEEHCGACHGERLRASGSARDLREIGPHERERFDKVVLEGKGQMPPWRGVLEPEQMEQIWVYIRSVAD